MCVSLKCPFSPLLNQRSSSQHNRANALFYLNTFNSLCLLASVESIVITLCVKWSLSNVCWFLGLNQHQMNPRSSIKADSIWWMNVKRAASDGRSRRRGRLARTVKRLLHRVSLPSKAARWIHVRLSGCRFTRRVAVMEEWKWKSWATDERKRDGEEVWASGRMNMYKWVKNIKRHPATAFENITFPKVKTQSRLPAGAQKCCRNVFTTTNVISVWARCLFSESEKPPCVSQTSTAASRGIYSAANKPTSFQATQHWTYSQTLVWMCFHVKPWGENFTSVSCKGVSLLAISNACYVGSFPFNKPWWRWSLHSGGSDRRWSLQALHLQFKVYHLQEPPASYNPPLLRPT